MGLSTNRYILLSFIVSISFIILGGILIPVFKMVTRERMKKQLPLKNGSESFSNWISPPVPVYFNVYVFNYTNAVEIMSRDGVRPHVKEMGPYVYKETQEKFDIKIENDTITYRERKSYTFVPEKSSGSETDMLFAPNLPALVVINFLKAANTAERIFADFFLAEDPIFKPLSVSDIVWGFKDSNIAKVASLIKKIFNITIPDEFGIFYGKNNTDDGVYTIYSGTENLSRLGKIKSWNGKSYVPYWNTPQCRQINGSDGTIFPPYQNEKSILYVFSSDICRSINTIYEKQYKLHNIVVNRYIPPSDLFTTGDINPANKGFCTPKCLPSGLLNVSQCQQNAPVVLSQPHFYQASSQVIESVKGIHPQKIKHETKLDLEPMTGIPMDVAKRLQVNLYIEKVKFVLPSSRIDKQVLPVLWIDENAQLTEAVANKFHQEVQLPLEIAAGVQYGLIAFGVFLLLFTLLLILRTVVLKNFEPTEESTPVIAESQNIEYDAPVPEMA